ncbi:lysosomal acid phosphatase isoform X2 [Dendroctonus ponderosae]|uniref:acid phosphatase n=1 Tax=Dendroctonus ponderosae TaxID=77166 RepID=U4URU7_DENPD|nr:lysosomal acid phosphatase isoform X2 [Dendroctonus ponderosae]ERL95253.1 hypothetical protein D910_12520 [Dendroctonus ponderosae]KAH1011552.1 hypothetical protein HUJ04_000899 [Dendroctonus ponderosae]KAH1018527.1 hypothetical protein HUJ05_006276 [Dendroctonus ponderosae]
MMWLRLLTAFALAALCGAAAPYKEEDDLKAVIVLYRHGDRSPLSSWPNDVYFTNTSLWPDGYGQLNNMGKQRHYQLGKWFRERYDGFLPRKYNYHDIYVRSTDVDRTLMSAASNLAGLYPPEGDQIWNENLLWQPIPIHTVPQSDDAIVATPSCAKHRQLVDELLSSEPFKQLNAELEEFFRDISEATGASINDITSLDEMYSTIRIYKEFDLALPEWTDIYWEQIASLAALNFQLYTYTTELARLRVGPFFDYLINHLQAVSSRAVEPDQHVKGPRQRLVELTDSSAVKFLVFSAHDTTVADRLNAMGVYNDAVPEFSSTVIWELREGGNGNYVNVFFKNTTNFERLTLPGCELNCPLEDFIRTLEPITTSLQEWTQECNA